MSYILGAKSRMNLRGVHPDLVAVVSRAITVTTVDFTVVEGVRSTERQVQLVQSGASKTLNSRHLTGHAVDLAAYVGGRIAWDWPLYYKLAIAMREAAETEGVAVRWGGVWDRALVDLDPNIQSEVAEYVARQRHAGKSAFIDGPHFELDRSVYP